MKSGPRLPQLEKALEQKRRPNIAINQSINKSLKKKKDTQNNFLQLTWVGGRALPPWSSLSRPGWGFLSEPKGRVSLHSLKCEFCFCLLQWCRHKNRRTKTKNKIPVCLFHLEFFTHSSKSPFLKTNSDVFHFTHAGAVRNNFCYTNTVMSLLLGQLNLDFNWAKKQTLFAKIPLKEIKVLRIWDSFSHNPPGNLFTPNNSKMQN